MYSMSVAGNTAVLHCVVTGSPAPRVLWRKSDGTLANMESGAAGEFLLRDVEVRDSGTLSCIATNNLGQHSTCNTSLVVIGGTQFYIINFCFLNRNL